MMERFEVLIVTTLVFETFCKSLLVIVFLRNTFVNIVSSVISLISSDNCNLVWTDKNCEINYPWKKKWCGLSLIYSVLLSVLPNVLIIYYPYYLIFPQNILRAPEKKFTSKSAKSHPNCRELAR